MCSFPYPRVKNLDIFRVQAGKEEKELEDKMIGNGRMFSSVFIMLILCEIYWATWTCKFMSFTKFEKSSATIFSNIFSISIFLLSLLNYNDVNVRSFDIVPQIPGALFIFFPPKIFVFFRLYNFHWSFTHFLTLPSVIWILLLSPSTDFLNFRYCISQF